MYFMDKIIRAINYIFLSEIFGYRRNIHVCAVFLRVVNKFMIYYRKETLLH